MSTMNKWLIAAGILIVTGVLICLAALKFLNFNFIDLGKSMNTVEYKTETFEVDEAFKNIDISAVNNDVKLLPAEDNKCKVVIVDFEDASHSVNVDNGTLMIEAKAPDKKTSFLGINTVSPSITIYLPGSEFADFTVNSATGDVTIPKDFAFNNVNIASTTCDVSISAAVKEQLIIGVTTGDIDLINASAGETNLSATTGDVNSSSFKCAGNVVINLITGDVNLEKTVIDGILQINITTGDIEFKGSDADTINAKTNTGSIKGNLLTDKNFTAASKIGDVEVPASSGENKCELTTNVGDIKIEIGE